MNKAYFIAPLVLLLAFIGYHGVHRSGYQQREIEKTAAAQAELETRREAELVARREAMTQAIAAAEQRKKEREEKAARLAEEQAARQFALDARDAAFRDQERSARHIERLKKNIEAEQTELARLAAERRTAQAEHAFLQEFVAKSSANVRALETLLARLDATAVPAAKPAK